MQGHILNYIMHHLAFGPLHMMAGIAVIVAVPVCHK
jgi:hypothetical protein